MSDCGDGGEGRGDDGGLGGKDAGGDGMFKVMTAEGGWVVRW